MSRLADAVRAEIQQYRAWAHENTTRDTPDAPGYVDAYTNAADRLDQIIQNQEDEA